MEDSWGEEDLLTITLFVRENGKLQLHPHCYLYSGHVLIFSVHLF